MIAALIAAGAALGVVTIDRIIVARAERAARDRELRRRLYAHFLGTLQALWVWSSQEKKGPSQRNLPAAIALGRDMLTVAAELQLVAPQNIVDVAQALSDLVRDWDGEGDEPPGLAGQRREFIRLARADVTG